MYFIDISQRAQKFLDRLESDIRKRIENTLKKLENNPVPSDAKFIGRDKGEKIFRYRIGNYRALYSIDDGKKIILVMKIDKRSKIYN
ncbi:type II toxin-antitoxin system mRNA interferase toxin, RelE/StbE family [Candidatus Pacearchaeota archaeon CG10_big_fil_rev_8_21_14_0_10_34_12]|nr:MAG: type II toxin-antitoxin system mRNA interferase toxin, RelE/StbE family [Candidatus Pacearchaeota archaeon CG10_big_fil_rev_8_21_14_0_10_34_12]